MSDITSVDSLIGFMAQAPSPYHVVDWISDYLIQYGFEQVSERDSWIIEPGKKQFCIRGGKSIIAWITGDAPVATAGFRIVGAHTDSPALRPRTDSFQTIAGLKVLDTSIYGSPIPQTWLDRDLGVAGAIGVRGAEAPRLFATSKPMLRSSTVAIHLDKGLREHGMKPNPHNHLKCIATGVGNTDAEGLKDIVASEMLIDPADILNMDLYLHDFASPVLLGGKEGLISSGRLDNLFSCFCAVDALAQGMGGRDATRVVALFDAEEIGSRTWLGATATFLGQVLDRIVNAQAEGASQSDASYRARAHSSCVSLDMAHGNHPLYPERLEADTAPDLNGGVALKRSYRGHYAMSAPLDGMLRARAADHGIPVQDFMYREDLGGGTSIGPLVAANLGIETVDAGAGLLGMHSIREIAGAQDVRHCIDFLSKAFFDA